MLDIQFNENWLKNLDFTGFVIFQRLFSKNNWENEIKFYTRTNNVYIFHYLVKKIVKIDSGGRIL